MEMGDLRIAIYIKNGKAASKITGRGNAAEVSMAIAHLELRKQTLLKSLKDQSDKLQGDRSGSK